MREVVRGGETTFWSMRVAANGKMPQDAVEVERLRQVLRTAIALMDEIVPPPWRRQKRCDLDAMMATVEAAGRVEADDCFGTRLSEFIAPSHRTGGGNRGRRVTRFAEVWCFAP